MTKAIAAALVLAAALAAEPLCLHPGNPHYFQFRGRPTVLITSGEHYGAVVNLDFNYRRYLETLEAHGFNLTRVFVGSYVEAADSFAKFLLAGNTLAPAPDRFLCPWPRAGGANKFDLLRFNDAFFERLAGFTREAGRRGVVVEVNLFTPMYEENIWKVNPMNARNNVNGIGDVSRTDLLTLKDSRLVAVQEALVRRIVETLREFDNVYYEICNEPYFAGVTREWQDRIAETIWNAEAGLPARHIISENVANHWKKIENPNPRVSLFNFHYARPPRTVEMNWALGKPIGCNETGFDGAGDDTYRIQAWDFLHAGGALFNHLDYSFTAGHEDGSFKVPADQAGGGSAELRRHLAALVRYMKRLDFIRMAPDAGAIKGKLPRGTTARVLSQPGRQYSVYLHHAELVPTGKGKERQYVASDTERDLVLALSIPAGAHLAEWTDTRSGAVLRTDRVESVGGEVRLRSPRYRQDIALRIESEASAAARPAISTASFRRHFIVDDIEERPKAGGWGYGTPAVADFDRDGDPDYTFCTRGDKIYWMENAGAGKWLRHVLGEIGTTQLGAVAADVDGDGWMDLVIGGVWYRNPRNPRQRPFTQHTYDSLVKREIHDIAAVDLNGDGRLAIVATGDRVGLYWYQVPNDPTAPGDWPRTLITDTVLKEKEGIHAGFAPEGVADLDGDGDRDIVLPDRWYENRAAGKEWAKHTLPAGKRGRLYGLSARSWVADLDGDGDPDIAIADCDQQDSGALWLENNGQSPPRFTAHPLPKTAPGVRGSFHSLAVADLDEDGDLDILAVEQEDPDLLPSGAPPRWFVWENLDGRARRFAERVILDERLGGHDVILADVDGDGDLDVLSKIWRRWKENANSGRFHADWLENLARSASR